MCYKRASPLTATSQSKYGRRFDEEFKREVAALACRPGARQEQIARDLGISPYSVSRWKKLYGGGSDPAPGAAATASTAGVSVQELERRIRALERENADLARAAHDPKKSRRHLLRTPAMRMATIKQLAGQHSVRKLCRILGVARSACYAAQQKAARPRAAANARLGAKARELFEASGRTYGSPRLTVALRRAGEPCGRHRVARLMRRAGLRARQKRRFGPCTTDSRHLCPVASNHLAEQATPPARPGEVWQADITYVATREGWLYVAGVLDACSRRIVGWAAGDTMPTALVARAFERAVAAHRPAPGLLHHSDRGSQYASDAYRARLRLHGVVPSMSRPGNCYDNARMESFWATLKGELIGDRVFVTRAEAKSALFHYIEVFYNRVRLHGALGYTSPVDFEQNLN